MASVAKREWTHNGETKTAWVVRYTDHGGNRRMKTFEKKKDADKYRTEVETELGTGNHTPDSETARVRAVCERFLKHAEQRVEAGTMGRARYTSLATVVKKHMIPALGHRKFNEVAWADVEGWHSAMLKAGLTPYTAKQYLSIAKMVEDFARKRRLATKTTIADVLREVGGARTPIIRSFQH